MAKVTLALSIVIPVFNEERTVIELLTKVRGSSAVRMLPTEIIVIDDGSTDQTKKLLKKNLDLYDVLITQPKNHGKGAAVQLGFAQAKGAIVIIQDADLEYDPEEYGVLIEPIIRNKADVVFGSRFVGSKAHRVVYFWHFVANKGLTLLSNMCTNINLTDMESCYKAFRRDVLPKLTLVEKGFGFEPEITAQVAKQKVRIYEVGISYAGRTYQEGKKIGLKDAFWAIWVIVRQVWR